MHGRYSGRFENKATATGHGLNLFTDVRASRNVSHSHYSIYMKNACGVATAGPYHIGIYMYIYSTGGATFFGEE